MSISEDIAAIFDDIVANARIEKALSVIGSEHDPRPEWQERVMAAVNLPPLTEAELVDVVDNAIADPKLGAGIGPDADTALRMVREIRVARARLALEVTGADGVVRAEEVEEM